MAIQAIKNVVPSCFSFNFLKKKSFFLKKIEETFGITKTHQILSDKNTKAEVLLENDSKILGALVYQKELFKIKILKKDRMFFKLNNFCLIGEHHENNEIYQKMLFERVLKLAKRVLAEGILLDTPDQTKNPTFSNDYEFLKIEDKKTKECFWYYLIKNESNEKEETHKTGKKRTLSATSAFSDPVERPAKLQKTDESHTVTDSIKNSTSSTPAEKTEPPHQETSSQGFKNPMLGRSKSESHLDYRKTNQPTTHSLPMKGTIYFDYIMSGVKKFEGRVCGHQCNSMKVGDLLKMFDNRARWGIICEITSVDKYKSFDQMLRDKGVLQMLPQLSDKKFSDEVLISEGVKIYESFPGAQRVRQAGAVAIGVKFLRKI